MNHLKKKKINGKHLGWFSRMKAHSLGGVTKRGKLEKRTENKRPIVCVCECMSKSESERVGERERDVAKSHYAKRINFRLKFYIVVHEDNDLYVRFCENRD